MIKSFAFCAGMSPCCKRLHAGAARLLPSFAPTCAGGVPARTSGSGHVSRSRRAGQHMDESFSALTALKLRSGGYAAQVGAFRFITFTFAYAINRAFAELDALLKR